MLIIKCKNKNIMNLIDKMKSQFGSKAKMADVINSINTYVCEEKIYLHVLLEQGTINEKQNIVNIAVFHLFKIERISDAEVIIESPDLKTATLLKSIYVDCNYYAYIKIN